MAKELCHSRKALNNIQNVDNNKCLKWCLVKYLNPAHHHPARITNIDKGFARNFEFKDIKFPVKITDTRKVEKKSCISVSAFGYENREKLSIYV